MTVLALDLAARRSAFVVMSGGREILCQEDSSHMSEREFIDKIVSNAKCLHVETIIIEDIPHQMRFDSITKQTCRLQGKIVRVCEEVEIEKKILWCPPDLWQRYHEGVWRGKERGAAEAAKKLGYEPPNLIETYKSEFEELHGKERQTIRNNLKKSMTDYVDAFLIARWALDTLDSKGTLDVHRTSRVKTWEIGA